MNLKSTYLKIFDRFRSRPKDKNNNKKCDLTKIKKVTFQMPLENSSKHGSTLVKNILETGTFLCNTIYSEKKSLRIPINLIFEISFQFYIDV